MFCVEPLHKIFPVRESNIVCSRKLDVYGIYFLRYLSVLFDNHLGESSGKERAKVKVLAGGGNNFHYRHHVHKNEARPNDPIRRKREHCLDTFQMLNDFNGIAPRGQAI